MDFDRLLDELREELAVTVAYRELLDRRAESLTKSIEALPGLREHIAVFITSSSPAGDQITAIASEAPELAEVVSQVAVEETLASPASTDQIEPLPPGRKRRSPRPRELQARSQLTNKCADCKNPCAPTAQRCHPCFVKARWGAKPKPEVLEAIKQREAEGRQASQRLKEFKQEVRSVAPVLADCGVCVIRVDNGNRFLAKQPGCPVHGIKGGSLASSLGGR